MESEGLGTVGPAEAQTKETGDQEQQEVERSLRKILLRSPEKEEPLMQQDQCSIDQSEEECSNQVEEHNQPERSDPAVDDSQQVHLQYDEARAEQQACSTLEAEKEDEDDGFGDFEDVEEPGPQPQPQPAPRLPPAPLLASSQQQPDDEPDFSAIVSASWSKLQLQEMRASFQAKDLDQLEAIAEQQQQQQQQRQQQGAGCVDGSVQLRACSGIPLPSTKHVDGALQASMFGEAHEPSAKCSSQAAWGTPSEARLLEALGLSSVALTQAQAGKG